MIIGDYFNKNLTKVESYPSKYFDTDVVMKLNASENHYIKDLFRDFNFDFSKVIYYPDSRVINLASKLAEKLGLNSAQLGFGNGSDEVIDLLIAMFVNEDENVIVNTPTFPMYKYFATVRGRNVKEISRKLDLTIDVIGIIKNLDSKDKLVFIDSPGNPTGRTIAEEDLVKILDTGLIVVLDEAYSEFSTQNFIHLLQKYENLIIIRSFSKWAGLAGVRLGYMIAVPQVIEKFNSIRPIYNVSSIAQELGIYVLDNYEKFESAKQKLLTSKIKIQESLDSNKYKVLSTETPFILVKLVDGDIEVLISYLEKNNVFVKRVKNEIMVNCISFCPPKISKVNEFLYILNNFK